METKKEKPTFIEFFPRTCSLSYGLWQAGLECHGVYDNDLTFVGPTQANSTRLGSRFDLKVVENGIVKDFFKNSYYDVLCFNISSNSFNRNSKRKEKNGDPKSTLELVTASSVIHSVNPKVIVMCVPRNACFKEYSYPLERFLDGINSHHQIMPYEHNLFISRLDLFGLPQRKTVQVIIASRTDIKEIFIPHLPPRPIKNTEEFISDLFYLKERGIHDEIPAWRNMFKNKRICYLDKHAKSLCKVSRSPFEVYNIVSDGQGTTRPFTVRETARVFGYHDNWEFHQDYVTAVNSIVDSCSPIVSKHIGDQLFAALNK